MRRMSILDRAKTPSRLRDCPDRRLVLDCCHSSDVDESLQDDGSAYLTGNCIKVKIMIRYIQPLLVMLRSAPEIWCWNAPRFILVINPVVAVPMIKHAC